MFINFTNHNSSNWGEEQINAAKEFGEILDIPFPNVNPYWDEENITAIADEAVTKILEEKPSVVLCQGEMNLVFSVVQKLKENNITVVSATTERKTEEISEPDGSITKKSVFKFVKFRKY